MSLYLRVAIGVLLAIAGAVGTLLLARYGIVNDQVQQGIRNNLLGPMRVARDTLEPTHNRAANSARLTGLFGYPVAIRARAAVPPRAWERWGDSDAGLFYDDAGALFAYLPLETSRDVLVLGPLPEVQFEASVGASALVVGLGLSIVAGTAFLVVAPMVRRLRELENATKRLSAGDLSARAAVNSRDDIGRVATHFNQMADEIQTLLEHQRQLLQAVSHEFRTPMARIRFEVEMAIDATSAAERTQRLESIDTILVEMDDLVAELLTYVRFDGRRPALEATPVPVTATLEALVAGVRVLRAGITLAVIAASDDDTSVLANEKYFRRVFTNLLLNALRYAHTTVQIRWRRTADAVIIEVHDDGPGIPASARARVFQPFARVDDSRSRGSGGAGLGLAIVERIMAWHQGSVSVDDTDLGGTRFVTRWPWAPPASREPPAEEPSTKSPTR